MKTLYIDTIVKVNYEEKLFYTQCGDIWKFDTYDIYNLIAEMKYIKYMKITKHGNKHAKIINQENSFLCLYCQDYQNLEQLQSQVLSSKIYTVESKAIEWANKQLNIN